MPIRPKRHEPRSNRNRKAEHDKERGSAAKRGYGRRWREAREQYLLRSPLCARCQARGIVTIATVVDHMIPHKGNERLFWDSDNWQSLCKKCHDVKTASEDGGFGRHNK